MEDVTPEFWDDRIAPQPRHYFFAIQAGARNFRRGGRAVVNMGSVSWMRGRPNLVGYTTAKRDPRPHANAARELGPRNIRINAVVPGAIVTGARPPDRDTAADRQFLDASA
ncbi:MAG: SDR family oxidoreductase [Betaproteobacteria bacterium]|nr:SDR family oxidoreductase [Betaproteobacteria bacterium]